MVRIKYGAENHRSRPQSSSIHELNPPINFEKAEASTPSELVPVHPWFCTTLRGVHSSRSTATFLVQPQDRVEIAERLRPFVVTVTNPPDTRPGSLSRYRATISIFYNNSAIRVADMSPVVEHTDRKVLSANELSPNQDGARNIYFVFETVKVDYVGEYTMHASIFRPDDDLNGTAFLATPWSTLVKVVPPSRRERPTSPTDFEGLVLADLGIELDSSYSSPSSAGTAEEIMMASRERL